LKKIENIILEILNNKDINIFSRNKAILILCDNNLTYDLDTCIKEDHDIFCIKSAIHTCKDRRNYIFVR
jgi:hypothetical protein